MLKKGLGRNRQRKPALNQNNTEIAGQVAARWSMTMPTKLPSKARAQERESNEAKNWLGLWALSLGFCAIILAGTASLAAGDHIGAALILLGAASIMGLIVAGTTEPEQDD
jgi:Flp pilus assembly protein TadB